MPATKYKKLCRVRTPRVVVPVHDFSSWALVTSFQVSWRAPSQRAQWYTCICPPITRETHAYRVCRAQRENTGKLSSYGRVVVRVGIERSIEWTTTSCTHRQGDKPKYIYIRCLPHNTLRSLRTFRGSLRHCEALSTSGGRLCQGPIQWSKLGGGFLLTQHLSSLRMIGFELVAHSHDVVQGGFFYDALYPIPSVTFINM